MTTKPGDAPTLTDAERLAYTEIITIAAKLVRGDGCLSEYRDDHDGMITKATLRSIAAQNDQFKEWAMRLRRAGDTLRAGAASRCPPCGATLTDAECDQLIGAAEPGHIAANSGIMKIWNRMLVRYVWATRLCRASVDVVQTLPVPDDAIAFTCICCRQTHYAESGSLLRPPVVVQGPFTQEQLDRGAAVLRSLKEGKP